MMKSKVFACLAAVLAFSALCGCNKTPAVNETTAVRQTTAPTATAFEPVVEGGTTAPYFRLSALPQLDAYKPTEEIFTRLNEEYTDRLVPSKSYGELIPFRGKELLYRISDEEEEEMIYGDEYAFHQKSPTYGLATVDGKIVVDAVYSYFDCFQLDNGEFAYFLYEQIDAEMKKVTVAASDGSWVIEGDYNTGCGVSDNRIILGKNPDPFAFEEGGYGKESTFSIFDYDGNFLFKVEGVSYVGEFSDGYAAVCTYWSENDEYYELSWFINENGEKVFGDFNCSVSGFTNGYAEIYDGDGFSDNYYIDTNGKKLREIPIEARYIREEDYWRFVSKETGLAAESTYSDDNIKAFLCKDKNGIGYVFDTDGETIFKAKGATDIEMINDCYLCICVKDENNKDWLEFIDLKTGETDYRIEMEYDSEGDEITSVFEYYGVKNLWVISSDDYDLNIHHTTLYDCERKKVVYDGNEDAWYKFDVCKANGKYYFGKYEGDFSVIYDEDNNLIMRVNTNSTD